MPNDAFMLHMIIGSDKGLSPVWRKVIVWTNTLLLSIVLLGTNFSQILIKVLPFFLENYLKYLFIVGAGLIL